jgi:hypothetical protein
MVRTADNPPTGTTPAQPSTGSGGGGDDEPGGDTPIKLRLDLNLDIEITIKASIHGDLTLSLL